MKFILTLVLLISVTCISISHKATIPSDKGSCQDGACSFCQNSLKQLKFSKQLNCANSLCPNNCKWINNQFVKGSNKHITFYLDNKIETCDACFRLGLCHFQQCELQKNLIKSTIHNTVSKFPTLHSFHSEPLVVQNFNRKFKNYSTIVNLVLSNIKRMLDSTQKYIELSHFSESLKQVYMKLYKRLKNDNFLKRLNIRESAKSLEFRYDDDLGFYRDLLYYYHNVMEKNNEMVEGHSQHGIFISQYY